MTASRPATIAEVLAPSFTSLVSSVYSAVLYNLGEIQVRGAGQVPENLELARFNLGLLEVLKDKGRGNLTAEETKFLDDAIANATLFIDKHAAGAADAASS